MDDEGKEIIKIIAALEFPKLGRRDNPREIYFDFVSPEVTPKMFYEYVMDKLGWPKLKYSDHHHHNIVSIMANGRIFYLRMQGETQKINGIKFSDWYKLFSSNPGPEPEEEGDDILKIISNSRISLGIERSPVEIFGFE